MASLTYSTLASSYDIPNNNYFIYYLPLTEFHASHLALSLLNGFNPPGLSVLTSPTDPYLKYLYKANLLSFEVSFPLLK